jgi:hypothetical protein
LIRIVLRRRSTPQERDCDKGITRCNCTHRHVLRWCRPNGKNSAPSAVAVVPDYRLFPSGIRRRLSRAKRFCSPTLTETTVFIRTSSRRHYGTSSFS